MAKNDRGTRVIAKAPILKNWSKNRDGSITANIFNSPDFRNNEKVTTSRIVDRTLKSGQLVTSVSGSKYRLEGNELQSAQKGDVMQKGGTFSVGNKAKLVKGTFSIKNAKFGPKRIPTLRKWKQNKDGSISGRIFGSKGFKENEFVTTSPMMGEPVANSVARTISGSRYYLEGNGNLAKKVSTKSTGTRSVKGESKGVGSIISGFIALAAATIFGLNAFQGPSVNNVVGSSVLGDADPSVSNVSTNDMKASMSNTPAPIEYKPETKEQSNESDRAEEARSSRAIEDVERRNEVVEAERMRLEDEKKELERLKAVELERLRIEEERARAKVDKEHVKEYEQIMLTESELEESEISSQIQEKDLELAISPSTKNILTGIGATAALSVGVAVAVANQNSGDGKEEKEMTPGQSPSPDSTQKDFTPVVTQMRGPSSTSDKRSSVWTSLDDSKLTGPIQTDSTDYSQDVVSTTTTSTTTRSTTRSSTFVGETMSKISLTSTDSTGNQVTPMSPALNKVKVSSIEKSTQAKIEESIEKSVESYCEQFVEEICDEMNML